MRRHSIRELTTLAYEGGHDFDPAQLPAPGLIDALVLAGHAGPIVPASSGYDRRRHARRASANTPASPTAPWPPTGAYGERISQLTTHDRLLRRDATPLAEQAEEEST